MRVDSEVFDGVVDIEAGVIDIRLGGPGGARDRRRECLTLAILLLRAVADMDGGWRIDWDESMPTVLDYPDK